jgi:hypothetical protein
MIEIAAGARFGMLTVIADGLHTRPGPKGGRVRPGVLVRCDCGTEKIYRVYKLNERSQCGAHADRGWVIRRNLAHIPDPVVGDEQGRWTVVETGLHLQPTASCASGRRALRARCRCGTERLLDNSAWRRDDIAPSCGCHYKNPTGPSQLKSGRTGKARYGMRIERDGTVELREGLHIGQCECAVARPLQVWAMVTASDAQGRIEIDEHVIHIELACACLLVERLDVQDRVTEVSYDMSLIPQRGSRRLFEGEYADPDPDRELVSAG